jgi:hypothetical protein
MESHFKLSDLEFENQFENCELAPTLFNHEAHLRIAWIYINRYGVEKAVIRLCSQLRNYVSHVGAFTKYNETLTIAAVRTVYHFMLKSKSHNFRDFISENLRLSHNFKELLLQHYKTDIFTSETAKREYLLPELLPFD